MSYEYTLPGRKFLAASISALGLAPMTWLRAQQASPKDEITIGVVGCGNQGCGVMNNFLNIQGVRVVAVCDVDAGQKDRAKAHVDNFYKNQDCKSYPHYGDLMQHPGLDAVLIGTPDHMHATVGIAAATLVSGYKARLGGDLPVGISKRYLGLRYTILTAAFTAGTVSAYLAVDVSTAPGTVF